MNCSYINCNSTFRSPSCLSFFKLPSDERKDMWTLHCGGEIFKERTKDLRKIFICEKHFRINDIISYATTKKLSKDSIPIPYSSSFCKCNSYDIDSLCRVNITQPTRKPYTKSDKITDINVDLSQTSVDPSGICSPPSPPYYLNRQDNVKTYVRDYTLPSVSERRTPSPSQFPEPIDKSCAPDCIVLPIKKPKLSNICCPLKVKIKKEGECSCMDSVLNTKSIEVKTFINAQLFHKSGNKWSNEEKKVFLRLYYKSPSCFKELQAMGFNVPHTNTIMRWHSQISFIPGLNPAILELLRGKCESMNLLEKKCILLFDEMSIKNELEYESREDVIYGYADLGEGRRSHSIASSALLLMIRGLNANWKQVLSYYIGSIKVDNLKKIIEDTVAVLLNIGFDVVAITCDQGSVNRSVYKKLGCEMEPFTKVQNKEIILLFDPPHLIKSVRNCLSAFNKCK